MLDLAFDRLQLDWKKHVQLDQMYYRTTEVDFQELIAKMVDADLAAEKEKLDRTRKSG